MRYLPFALAAITAVTPAAAQVRVAMGEEVRFTLETSQAAPTRAPATPTPYEIAIAQEFARGDYADAIGASGLPLPSRKDRPAGPRPEPERIRMRFTPIAPQGHSLLLVENGYAQALVYRAKIGARGKTAPTDVCLVPPGKSSIEHWPYAIESIEVSDLRLVPWKPEDGLPCK